MKIVLSLFDICSGLKANFSKSKLIGLNVQGGFPLGGGLGVKDIHLNNPAILGKWKWMSFHEDDNLQCNMLKSNYGHTTYDPLGEGEMSSSSKTH
ncbi:hypothetical protein Lal_00028997, partial [Lupinus albus]